jgi:hypothetical protein
MSVTAQSVHLSLNNVALEIETQREELSFAIAHIYRRFLFGDSAGEAKRSSQSHEIACNSAISSSDQTWQAQIDDEEFEWTGFDVAVCCLEDAVADRLLKPFRDSLLIHSAAVANQSKTIFLAGPSGSGKTTLALELVNRGMKFITDEFSIVRPFRGEIQPFPRAATRKFNGSVPEGFSFRSGGDDSFRSHFLPINTCGLDAIALQNTFLIFPKFVQGHELSVNSMDSGEACALLLPSIFDFENRENEQWLQAAEFVTRSQSFEVKFGDAKIAADSILTLNH